MPSLYEDAIHNAQDSLRRARAALTAEIADYPTPIAGCDAQFNQMLADRQKVLDALRVLESAVFVPTPRAPTEVAGIECR